VCVSACIDIDELDLDVLDSESRVRHSGGLDYIHHCFHVYLSMAAAYDLD